MAKLMVCIKVPVDYKTLKEGMESRGIVPHLLYFDNGKVIVGKDVILKSCFNDVAQRYEFELIGVRP